MASSQCREVYPDLHSLTPPPILFLYLSLIPQCSKADRQLNKQRNLFREDTDGGKKLFCISITHICNSRWQACLGGIYGPPPHTLYRRSGIVVAQTAQCSDALMRSHLHAPRNHVEAVNAFTRFWRSAFSLRIYVFRGSR